MLVDNKGGIKISDFGISKKVDDSKSLRHSFKNHELNQHYSSVSLTGNRINRPSLQGSVFWMAPEVVKQTGHTRKADIWSLGCLVVEMFTGEHPWAQLTQMQAIFKVHLSRFFQISFYTDDPSSPRLVRQLGPPFLPISRLKHRTFFAKHLRLTTSFDRPQTNCSTTLGLLGPTPSKLSARCPLIGVWPYSILIHTASPHSFRLQLSSLLQMAPISLSCSHVLYLPLFHL